MSAVPESMQETIVAIATPPGRGGIGIVRLSGPRAREIAAPMLRLHHALEPGRARFGELLDAEGGEALDEVVATLFATPHSYTGEDVVEIAAHGAPVLLEELLRRCIAAGARLAEPGEFTERAFHAGRLDLTQAEAVHDLIEANTLEQARVAARQMGGALSREVAPVKERLLKLIAGLEAGIDFAEDDVDVMPAEQIVGDMAAVRAPLERLEQSFAYGRVVREGFSLALVGRPNAGKSSLFNRLLRRERAIVTAAPGTTRDTVSERMSLEGIPVEVIDTAGLRVGELDEAEALGIARSREAMAEASVLLLIVDATFPLHAEDAEILRSADARTTLLVLNKTDLALVPAAENSLQELRLEPAPRVVRTSALTGSGVEELRLAIHDLLRRAAPQSDSVMVTNMRQHQAIVWALESLEGATRALEARVPHEMLLVDLYGVLESLDALTGATTTDDILNRIFSTFCIGK